MRAANRSRGGKVFIVLPSTAKNDSISRIVPVLSPGTHVSNSKDDFNYVVTEYDVAQLRWKSAGQLARELIGIAHPDFRAELMEQAGRMGILLGRLSRYGRMLTAWAWWKRLSLALILWAVGAPAFAVAPRP